MKMIVPRPGCSRRSRHRCHSVSLFFAVTVAVFGAAMPLGNSAIASMFGETFHVGDTITGTFAYDISEFSADVDQSHVFNGPNSFISLTIGHTTFASSRSSDLLVNVTDGDGVGRSDFIQLRSTGDATSFDPYLAGFSCQNPSLEPIGNLIINFHFPHTYLDNTVLPLAIDPSATTGPLPGSSFPPIYGQIEGVSLQTQNIGLREWSIFFSVNPDNMIITAD